VSEGALQNMVTQGFCSNAKVATSKFSRDSCLLNPCTNRLWNSLSTSNVMNSESINCTPSSHLYSSRTPSSYTLGADGVPRRGSYALCSNCPYTSHRKYSDRSPSAPSLSLAIHTHLMHEAEQCHANFSFAIRTHLRYEAEQCHANGALWHA